LAPLSGSIDDSLQPEFRWVNDDCKRPRATAPGRGTVEVCRDRACRHVLASFRGAPGRVRPPSPLPAGVVFWRVVTGAESSETWQLTIPHRESGRPIAFAAVPDYNGDGLADLALGVRGASGGEVQIFYGAKELPGLTPDHTLMGRVGFGCGVGAVGDTNGDGFMDLAVATDCGTGPVRIYNGGAGGFRRGRTLPAGPVTSGFGTRVASAGDVDGDGYGDVIVGGLEMAQVFLGGPAGVSPMPAISLPVSSGATTVQGPGDVNGDGLPDVAVGFDVQLGALFLGTGQSFVKQDIVYPREDGNSFAGDLDGDGFVDFDSFGVIPGTPNGIDFDHPLALQPTMPIYLAAGDIDGDGFGDQIRLVGGSIAPEHYRILFGQAGGCGGLECQRFVGLFPPGLTDRDFAIVAGVGDVNGDRFDDLVVARPSIGAVYLYLGGPGFPGSPARTWTRPVGFGASVPALFGTATFYDTP
jgi:hypothetical protein